MLKDYIDTLPSHWRPAAAVFSALGDPTRHKILLLFEAHEELSIKDIADVLPAGRTTIVHHLAVLRRAGILSVRRKGKSALYRPHPETVLESLNRLRDYIFILYPELKEKLPPFVLPDKLSKRSIGDKNL